MEIRTLQQAMITAEEFQDKARELAEPLMVAELPELLEYVVARCAGAIGFPRNTEYGYRPRVTNDGEVGGSLQERVIAAFLPEGSRIVETRINSLDYSLVVDFFGPEPQGHA